MINRVPNPAVHAKPPVYCSVICQTANWAHHREECDGHLRKVGMANLVKAKGFERERNWVQALRYGEIAATKLKLLKDRRLETVIDISNAFICKLNSLQRLNRHREAHECIKECYTLWAMNHLRHPGSMNAALSLIQSCLHNDEYEDAERYARHAYFMIAEMTDNFIPSEQQLQFLADASYYLALAIIGLASAGGIQSEGKQKAGEEAIEHARKALEMYTQLHGTEHERVAASMSALASALEYFNDDDNDETLRLREQATAIYRLLEGSLSMNVAINEFNFGNVLFSKRAKKAAHAANDVDRCLANLELALPHYREAARIFKAINHVDNADNALRNISEVEELIQRIVSARAAAAGTRE